MSDFVKAFKKRSKNYVFWTALFALIGGIVVNHFNLIDAVEYQDFINLLLAFFVAAGICNDPTSGKGLSDGNVTSDKKLNE